MPISRRLGTEIITVVVGIGPATEFGVHKRLLYSESEYFKQLLFSHQKAWKSQSVELKEAHPETFQIYVYWLYRRALPVRDTAGLIEETTSEDKGDGCAYSATQADASDPTAHEIEYLRLAKAYALGVIVQDTASKDAVIDAIFMKAYKPVPGEELWYPSGSAISYIYEHTSKTSEIRCLLADIYVRYADAEALEDDVWDDADLYPREFLLDLAKALFRWKAARSESDDDDGDVPADTCKYHGHDDGHENCYKTRFAMPYSA